MTRIQNLIDTHAHLDDGQFPDVDAVIDHAVAQGVTRIVNIGYGPNRWDSTIALARRRPEMDFALGIHPLDADHFNDELFDRFVELVNREQPVAIGEAGIDLFRDGPQLTQQRAAFAAQIELALARKLPLIIHQRAAESEVNALLSAADRDLRVVLHSFDGSQASIDLVIDRGWTIGVGGLMTRASSAPLREMIRKVPLSSIVLETDSPYLVPAGVKDRRNTPANVPLIAQMLADARREAVEDVARVTTENVVALFPRLAVTV